MSTVIELLPIRKPLNRGETIPLRVAIEPTFDFTSAEYSRLFDRSGATAFQHPVWLQAFFRDWAPKRGAQPIIVTGRCPSAGLCFVLPLILRQISKVSLLESADLGVSDYAAPVVDSRWWETYKGRDKLAEQIAHQLPPYDILRIKPVRPEHLALWRTFLPGESRGLGFNAHATPVAGPMESWREGAFTGSFARMLTRKRTRFFRSADAKLVVLEEPAAIGQALTKMAQWRSGRFPEDIIQDPAALNFYRSVAVTGAAAKSTRTYALKVSDEAVGYAFAIAAGGRLNYLLIGCNYAEHGRHSPGLLIYDGMIADWIEQGGSVFDFTIGDEPFKADFGTSPTPMFEIYCAVGWRGALATLAFRLRERWRARNHLAETLPALKDAKG